MAPLVSIGLPVYNGDDFIRKCLDSLLVQSYSNLEIIICDNASTDTTEDICRAYADRDARIKYYRNEKNLGAAPNYNKCFEVSTGQYFKWIAHDDWLSENYIEDCVDILETHDEFVMAFGMPQEMLDDDTIFLDGDFTVEMTGPIAPLEHFAHAGQCDQPAAREPAVAARKVERCDAQTCQCFGKGGLDLVPRHGAGNRPRQLFDAARDDAQHGEAKANKGSRQHDPIDGDGAVLGQGEF